MEVHVHHHFTNSLTVQRHPELESVLSQLTINDKKIMALLDDLTAQVARNTTVEQSAVELLKGLKAKLDAAGTDPVQLKALSDQLGANTDALATAVSENTPAA